MRVVQRFPLDYWATIEVDAGENSCRWRYKSLVTEVEREYRYEDIDGRTERMKQGEPGANNASLFFFILSVIVLLINSFIVRILNSWVTLLPFALLAFATIACFLAQFRKSEYIYFFDKEKKPAFYFDADKSPELVDFILGKISSASTEPPPREHQQDG